MLEQIRTLSKDLIDLLYPYHCVSCGTESAIDNHVFCLSCAVQVSYTNHFTEAENELLFRFSGRVELDHGAAMYDFIKNGSVQDAIHKLKYKKQSEIGVILGKQFGQFYNKSPLFEKADFIIPIPVHGKRLRTRGYNQSFMFAKGISEITDIPIKRKVLGKANAIKTQTKKRRIDRFNNVLTSFTLKNKEALIGKTVLLVDDVVTTGATLEAAISMLSEIENIKIQLGVIALAND